jgi:hypothetical protein
VDWAIELQLHQTLNKLLRYAAVHCKSALLHSSIASAALFGAAQSSLWAPSDGMVAAAVGALCAAFTHNHAHAKQCFASTGEAAAAVLSSASSLASAQRGRSSSAAAVGGNAVPTPPGHARHLEGHHPRNALAVSQPGRVHPIRRS